MATNAAPIIVKRKKGGEHGGHHGGAWKVAYADFVTAMMAFFLLLWLLNSTTQEQRSGISEYFNPASTSRTTSGAGQILSGATITLDGPMKGRGAPIGMPIPAPQNNTNTSSDARSEDKVDTGTKTQRVKDPDNAGKNPKQPKEELTESQMQAVMRQQEEKRFDKVEQAIKRAIETTPALRKLANNLIIDRTEEGLRIQIVDQNKVSMFARGSAVPYELTDKLLKMVAGIIAKVPNKVAISGHTDSTPYSRGSSYTNWELSSDRAQAARRALTFYGLPESRVSKVVGRADTEPLIKSNPKSPLNRRLSITLLRQTPLPPKVGNIERPPPAPAKIAPPPPVVAGTKGIVLPPRPTASAQD